MDEAIVERVSQYLSGRMSSAEREAFRQELPQNSALQAEYEFQETLLLSVAMQESRQQVAAELQETPVRRFSFPRPALMMAAAVAVLLLLVGLWYLNRPTPPSAMLAMAEEFADPTAHLEGQSKGPGDASEATLLDSLSQWLRQAEYSTAIERLGDRPLPPAGKLGVRSSELGLGLGIAYLHAEPPVRDLDQASRWLDRVARGGSDATYRNQARKQRVFLALAKGKPELARVRLDSLAQGSTDPQPWLQREAQQLQEKWGGQ